MSGLAGRALVCVALAASLCCKSGPREAGQRTFQTPEEAAQALNDAAKAQGNDGLMAIFGGDVKDLVDSSDPTTARRNRQVFNVAFKEGWRWIDQGTNGKMLVIGHESWPFPVPLVKEGNGWRFDTAAGKEEVIARRIGRNELAVIRLCQTYVKAQQLYARQSHDGKPAGAYAATVRSTPGQQNGLYWRAALGQKASPLGDLVAEAAAEGRDLTQGQPSPFHGYYFRVLTAQGAAAPGGAKDYSVQNRMSGGFALVAWPAQYDATGVMTFIVNQDGIVRQKDLGPGTDAEAKGMTLYNPDASWEIAQ